MKEQTLIVLKPDAVSRGLVGDIVSRFEKVGLKIVAARMVQVSKDLAERHYPRTRTEWIKMMGEKTLENYEKYSIDPIEKLGTNDKEKNWAYDSRVVD